MQDAGDSPPDRQRSEGRKRRNFSAPRRIRPKPGTASDRRTPRSRCGVSEHNRLTQRFAPRNRRRGLLWWIAPVELRGGAENRKGQEQVQKKTAKKIAVIRVELNFRAEVSAATHIGWTKRSSFFHRLQDPKFRLSRHRVRGTVVRQTPVSCFVLGPVRDLRIPLRPLFQSQATVLLSLVFLRVTTYLIRSPPGPGIIRRAAPVRARRHQRHRRPESRPAAWRRVPRTRSRAPAASRRPS